MKYSRSKKFAVGIFIASFILAGVCAYLGMEGATSAVFSTGTLASTGLYVNKQVQTTQQLKIEKGTNNG